ncbi:hypothetical protein INS49_010643 [Diaporthe citri]|uniref:uncharacterized protein n=1 Tax=Diaporthe citri TaxID=83186 RepID=UPI001C7FECD1|nr:uncharacterized protein INS49_010643 [Diaporthe citri]KAG6362413.1 hypothetical protein INS49_010643 [Diaporthe citri]
MAASLDIDSSDFEDVVEEHDRSLFASNPNIGKRVSALIVANQAVDRPLSKKNARELTYAHGAPKTRDVQHSVMAIWDTFCTTINHEVRRSISVISGKTVPSLSFIRKVWRILIDLLTFRHEDLPQHYTPYHEKRINVHLSQLWFGFKVIQQMAQTWLERALNEGCLSWDRTLLKLLGILLQASCSSRSGDVARSSLYEGFECLCYKHLELSIKDRKKPLDSVQNLTLKVTQEFMKNYKGALRDAAYLRQPVYGFADRAVALVANHTLDSLDIGRMKAGKSLKRAATDAWKEEQNNAREAPAKAAPAKKVTASAKRKAQPLAKPTPKGDLSNADPRLLAWDDVESANVDEHELDYVCDLIDGRATGKSNEGQAAKDSGLLDDDQDEANDEEVEQVLADELQPVSADQTTPTRLTGNALVTKCATINVYKLKRSFDSSDPDVVSMYVPTGNSRDPPEPFLYFCSKCGYSNRWVHVVEMHEAACTVDPDATANEERYHCHYEGCSKSYPKETTLKAHIHSAHQFVPKPCVQCPDKPDVIFNTQYELTNDRTKFHNDLDNPTMCLYQDECGKQEAYNDKKAFKLHLCFFMHLTH